MNDQQPSQAGNGLTPQRERKDFGGQESTAMVETASTAIAAKVKAEVEARYIMALRRPRDWDNVRDAVMKLCARPHFADMARYHKPIGDGIEGPSIRFVEAVLQEMGNAETEAITLYDDAEKRVIQVVAIDLERNVRHASTLTVSKTVERRKPTGEVLSQRRNARGDVLYICAATDDDVMNKQNSLISKAVRTCGLRLIPAWLTDEAQARVVAVQKDKTAKDPEGERSKIADAFSAMGVPPSELKEYLDHDFGSCSPAELAHLKVIYATVRDGESTWPEIIAHKRAQRGGEAPASTEPAPKSGTAGLKAKMAKSAPAATESPSTASAPAASTTPAATPTPTRDPGSDDDAEDIAAKAEQDAAFALAHPGQ